MLRLFKWIQNDINLEKIIGIFKRFFLMEYQHKLTKKDLTVYE